MSVNERIPESELGENLPHVVLDRADATQDTVRLALADSEDEVSESPEVVRIREQLENGEVPQEFVEDWRLVDPESREGMQFQQYMEDFLVPLYEEQDVDLNHPLYDFMHHDFVSQRVRFMLSKQSHPNAWFVSHSAPPIIVLTEGMFQENEHGVHVENPTELAGVLMHEMTHMKMREKYGNIENSKQEEALAYGLPVIMTYEKGRRFGLNTELFVTEDGTGFYDRFKKSGRNEEYWSQYMDVHPTRNNVHSIATDALAGLRDTYGKIEDHVAQPPENTVYCGITGLCEIFQSASHTSYLDSALGAIAGYESLPVPSKLQILQGVIEEMDVEFYPIRWLDIRDHLQGLIEECESALDWEDVAGLGDTMLDLLQVENAPRNQIGWCYGQLSQFCGPEKELPVGRLRSVDQILGAIVQHIEENSDPSEIVPLAERFNEQIEGFNFTHFGPESGLIYRLRWSGFAEPDRSLIDVEDWGDDHFAEADYGDGNYDEFDSDSFDNYDDEDDDLFDNEDESVDEVSVEISWRHLPRLVESHPAIARFALYSGAVDDPHIREACMKHRELFTQWLMEKPSQPIPAIPFLGNYTYDADHSVSGFHERNPLDNHYNNSRGATNELIVAECMGLDRDFVSTVIEREIEEAKSCPEKRAQIQEKAKVLMPGNTGETLKVRMDRKEVHQLVCLNYFEYDLELFVNLNEHNITSHSPSTLLFVRLCWNLVQDRPEKIPLLKQVLSRKNYSIMHFYPVNLTGYVAHSDQDMVVSPWKNLVLGPSSIFSPTEQRDILEIWTRTKPDRRDGHLQNRTDGIDFIVMINLNHFEGEEAQNYINTVDPVLREVGVEIPEPQGWEELLLLCKSFDAEHFTLEKSALYAYCFVLVSRNCIPTIPQFVQLESFLSASLFDNSYFQRALKEKFNDTIESYGERVTKHYATPVSHLKTLERAGCIFPDVFHDRIGEFIEKFEPLSTGDATQKRQCAKCCEIILGGKRIQNPRLRSRLIGLWVETLYQSHGLDRDHENYETYKSEILDAVYPLKDVINASDYADISRQVAKKLQAQDDLAQALDPSQRFDTAKLFEGDARMFGFIGDTTLDLIRNSIDAKRVMVDFLTNEGTWDSIQYTLEELVLAIGDLDYDRNEGGHKLTLGDIEERNEVYFYWVNHLRALHQNFRAAPIEYRALTLKELLIDPDARSTELDQKTLEYALERIVPRDARFGPEAHRYIGHMVRSCRHYMRHIILSAGMSASEKTGDPEEMNIGEPIAYFAEGMGTAFIRTVQRMDSDPRVPEEIRTDTKRLKYAADEPPRYESTAKIEKIREDLESQVSKHYGNDVTIKHIGQEVGSGSVFVAIRLHMSNGKKLIVSLRRPNALDKGRDGFDVLSGMNDRLSRDRRSVGAGTFGDLIYNAKAKLDVDVDCTLAPEQYGGAKGTYEGTLQWGDQTCVSEVSDVVACGEDWFLMEEMAGEHFAELEDMEVSPEEIQYYAMMILFLIIRATIMGRFICADRHGGNIKIDVLRKAIGHFDFKSVLLEEWGRGDFEQLIEMCLGMLSSEVTSDNFVGGLMDQQKALRERLANEGGELSQYVCEIQEGMITAGEYVRVITPEQIKVVVMSALLSGDMHPEFRECLLDKVTESYPLLQHSREELNNALERGEWNDLFEFFVDEEFDPSQLIQIMQNRAE